MRPPISTTGAFKRFGQLHDAFHAFLRAAGAVGQNHRILRRDEHFGRFRHRAAVALRRDREGELGNTQFFFVVYPLLPPGRRRR